MGCIVLLVDLELTRCVGYNLVSLHEDTAETKVRSITLDNEVVASVGQRKNRSVAQHVLEGLKTVSCAFPHTKGLSLWVRAVSGTTILENPSMNRR